MTSDSGKLNCWLDCDPGSDDAFAIIMALYSERLNLLGISSVAGNQTVDKTTRNVLNVLNIMGLIDDDGGLPIPVIEGAAKPLMRELHTAQDIFGDSGLDTHTNQRFSDIPQSTLDFMTKNNNQNHQQHFTTRIYQLFKQQAPARVNLIAVGPLTNIALLLLNHPDVVDYIDKLIIMGGAYATLGNTGPVSEFNIHVDPEAASIVFNQQHSKSERRLNIYMVPLDVTYLSRANTAIINRIGSFGTKFTHILVDLLNFYRFRLNIDPPLHDPCAVAFLIDPTMFDYELTRVEVVMGDGVNAGQTICDLRKKIKQHQPHLVKHDNVHVCTNMNVDKFWQMMIDSIAKANQKLLVHISTPSSLN